MNQTTYKQIWSLHQKGTSLKASIETIQAITLSRDEATPWLTRFMEDYANEQVCKELEAYTKSEMVILKAS